MRLSSSLILLLSTALPLITATCTNPLSTKLASTVIQRKYANGLGSSGAATNSYDHVVVWRGLESLYNTTGNATYLNYIKASVDNVVTSSGGLNSYAMSDYNLDLTKIGETLIFLYQTTKTAKYKTAADLLRKQLQTQPRNPAGGFWHKKVYPNQMWLDGIYMADTFYAHYTKFYQPTNTTAIADIVKQFTLVEQNCASATQTGLLKHGYDSSRTASWSKTTLNGQSPEVWIRAYGWLAMALVETIEYLGVSTAEGKTLQGYLATMATALKANVDATSGLWWLVMSQPGATGNYFETSGSSMFVYAVLKGVRLGYLDDSSGGLKTMARTAYKSLVESYVSTNTDGGLDFDGTVQVGSLSGSGTYDYYIGVPVVLNDLKGYGAFIHASIEYEKDGCN